MKKLLYCALTFCVVCLVYADDRIIQFVLKNGQHHSFRTSEIRHIGYDYHDQDSIDKAYTDSIIRDKFVKDSIARAEFLRDSLYADSIMKENHRIDSIGRLNTLGFRLDSAEHYRIFAAALKLTGFYDTLNVVNVRQFNDNINRQDIYNGLLYAPTSSRNGFTVFAEPDSVMQQHGINNVDDLIAYANQAYGKAPEWYDYLAENHLSVSTDNDYTNRQNALNMFVAYHVLKTKMAADELVYENNAKNRYWNYVNDGQPYDYYETMLPQTLIKVWKPLKYRPTLLINRYVTFNTLTDEVGTMGSQDMHKEVLPGINVVREDGYGYNGYYHPIGDMLVYSQQVPRGVLHERLRFDFASQQSEMSNNGFRYMTFDEAQALNGGSSSSRIAFANDYFENIRVLEPNTRLRYNLKGAYNAYQSDALQVWSSYDIAVKLPPLPAGDYEVRLAFSPMTNGGIVQFYLGEDPSANQWIPYGIPFDLSIEKDDPRIGWTNYQEEEDLGVASDKKMRELGYMRGPHSFKDHPEYGDENGYSMRSGTRNASLRKILGNLTVKQAESKWLRIKPVTTDYDLRFQLDFIEFVPIDVVNNEQYMEDWY